MLSHHYPICSTSISYHYPIISIFSIVSIYVTSLYFCVSGKHSIRIIDSFSVDYADFPFPFVLSLLLSADFFLPVFTPPLSRPWNFVCLPHWFCAAGPRKSLLFLVPIAVSPRVCISTKKCYF